MDMERFVIDTNVVSFEMFGSSLEDVVTKCGKMLKPEIKVLSISLVESDEDDTYEEVTTVYEESTESDIKPRDAFTAQNEVEEKLLKVINESLLAADEDVEDVKADLDRKVARYTKWYKPMVDEILESLRDGNKDLIEIINGFSLDKESHVTENKWYSPREAFGRDVQYKLLPELYENVQDKIKAKYEEDGIPYVILYSSESPEFPCENKVYTLMDFNDRLFKADYHFHNRKKYAEEKYGSADNYWDLEREDKLPEEDKGIQFGYDKTNFKIFNIPNPKEPDDTFSYEPSRYDIGDGNGSLFDYVRSTCSHDEFIEALNELEEKLLYSKVNKHSRKHVKTIIKGNKTVVKGKQEILKSNLAEAMVKIDEAQKEYKELHKKWLIEASDAERVEANVKNAVQNYKAVIEKSMNSVFKDCIEVTICDRNVTSNPYLSFVANEVKKMVIEELYLPSRMAQKAMNEEDYKTYNSVDWAKIRRIWDVFPANVNMTAYVEDCFQDYLD